MVAAGFQHERGRHDDRRVERDAVALVCQQAAEHIAAQRIADGRGRRGTKFALQPAQEPGAVFRLSGVVDAVIAVRLAATAAEMHHHAEPAALHGGVDQTVSVRAVQAAFQTVKNHQPRLMAG